LLYLAAAGIGRIGIIDFDRVEESNLQRQILFGADTLGQPKASQAAQHLQNLNPTIRIEAFDTELDAEKAALLFPQYDIIIDGTDNFETKFLINDAAVKFGKPWIYGAIQGFDGQVSVFNDKGGPCYRCLYPEKPKGRIMNCAEAGVIGAVAGLIGITQALQAIQIIAGHKSFDPLSGKLMTLDTRTMHSRLFTLQKNPDCKICSQKAEEISLSYTSPLCGFVPDISVTQMQQKHGYILIDVREQPEWEQGHIAGAQLWPLSKIMQGKFPDAAKDADIILHCQKGIRSLQAAQILKANGFQSVSNLIGGYEAWLEER
jgi:adenylyltransferase/sulfurtransferase